MQTFPLSPRVLLLAILAVAAGCGSDTEPALQSDAGAAGHDASSDFDAVDATNDTQPPLDSGGDVSDEGEGGPEDAGDANSSDGSDDSGDATSQDSPVDVLDESQDAPGDATPDPYQAIEHLRNQALLDALHNMVKDHTSLGYDLARDVMFGVTGSIDVHQGMIESIYTGAQVAENGTHNPPGFNTEHSWPRGDGTDTEPAESDLHHLFPCDTASNNARGSYPFGNTNCNASGACDWFGGGSELGTESGGSTLVFEVRPVRRGDIARAHFYIAVRYQMAIPASEESVLRTWHDNDLPDSLEQGRNDAIEGYQNNRNPFVDRPDFVAFIANY